MSTQVINITIDHGMAALGRKQKFNLRDYRLAEGISRSTWYRRRRVAHGRGRSRLAAASPQITHR